MTLNWCVWGEEGGAPAFSEARDPGPTLQVRAPEVYVGVGAGEAALTSYL